MAIRVVAKLANEAEVQQKLLAITAEYAEVFRQEFMNLIGEEIIEEAKSNIEIGAQSSRTPPTHNLARSLRHSINKQGVLSVFAGETGPSSLYAHIHNVPRGQYTTLRAHRDYMKFFWYRYNVPMKKEVVYRPGTGFLSEAAREVTAANYLNMLAKKVKRHVQPGTIFNPGTVELPVMGDPHHKFGSMGYKGAQKLGLVRRKGGTYVLTAVGEQYIRSTRGERKAYRNKKRKRKNR